MSYTRMPWGKHKGRLLCDCPGAYLWWVLEECDSADHMLKHEIRSELARRLPQPPPIRVVQPNADRAKILDWCRRAAVACHPDHGGSFQAMKLVNELRSMLI
jgi:hypothetical protein